MHVLAYTHVLGTAAIDAAVRASLAESVARVLEVAARFGVTWSGDLAAWSERLKTTPRAPPQLWAVYHDLVQATSAEDPAAVSAMASDLLARLPADSPPPGAVVTLTEADLGADVARVAAVVDNDPANPLRLKAIGSCELVRVRTLMSEARALMTETAPALLDEVDTLGRVSILATGDGVSFGGAASVFLWGAVVLNPTLSPDRVSLVEGLAHETAHALLFGLTLGRDLTKNDPTERYASPLRRDPRPIEGVVHATYVLARMAHALEALRGSARLSEAERRLLEEKLAQHRRNYASVLETVANHARFTPEGAAIFAACREAMSA